jgi:hypothetical protein
VLSLFPKMISCSSGEPLLSTTTRDLEIAKGSAESSNFTSVAFVAGQGNVLTVTNYMHSLWDLVPGQYYARLRQVDFSGGHSYSGIVSFKVYGTAPLVYPTIVGVNGKVNIVLSNAGDWNAGLYDAEGRLLQTGEWLLEEGESATRVMSIEGLLPGFYFIQIEERATGARWTEKLVRTKDF